LLPFDDIDFWLGHHFVHFICAMFCFDMAESWFLLSLWWHSLLSEDTLAEFTLTDGRPLSSKVGLMEEDHNLQVLVPMRNLAMGVAVQ
jgi:hypothetical protein